MKKRILINFVIDRLIFIAGYFLCSVLLTLFFHLSTGKIIEIVYPAAISLFILIFVLVIQWMRYYSLFRGIYQSITNPFYDLHPRLLEHKTVAEIINNIHQFYIDKITVIQKENKERNYFLSQWVHSMKAPASIIGLIIQEQDWTKPDTQEAIRDIQAENDKIIAGMEQVLSIIRLGDFSKDYAPESIDLIFEIRKIVNLRKRQFIYNRVFPRIECEMEELLVVTDSKWNDILIDQLVSNAIKYSRADGKGKDIQFIIAERSGYATLTIKDYGIGIPPYDLKRVFEPFFTGENGRKVKNATGIGLYLCALIADKLGHRLNIESKPDCGTEVTITYLTKT